MANRLNKKTVFRTGSIVKEVFPLAQSFLVEEASVLTKLDLYFSAKDDVLPVTVNLRKMINGLPSSIVLPFSEVSIPSANISVSANSLSATSVIFPSPVYVEPGEYCLSLFSNSDKVKLWVSQLGEVDVSTGGVIQKQPTLGVLFKSTNGTTWSPDQLQDLKFKIYRAKFTVVSTATVDFCTCNLSGKFDQLPYDPLEVYPNSTTMKVYHPKHGFKNGSYTVITRLEEKLFSNVLYYGLYPANITGVAQLVSNVSTDSYTVTLPKAVDANVTGPTRFGRYMAAFSDIKYTDIYPAMAVLNNSDSTVLHSIKTTDTDYVEDSSYEIILPTDHNFGTVRTLPTGLNRSKFMSNAKAFTYRIEMTTNDPYVAPIIDLEKTGVVFLNNEINNPNFDTEHIAGDIRLISMANNISFTRLSNTTGTLDLVNTNARANAVFMPKGSLIRIRGSANNTGNVRILEVLNNGANVLLAGNVITEVGNGLAAANIIITNGPKYIVEKAASGSSSKAKYITRQINFVNPSTAFKLFLDVSKPTDTYLKFYYRTSLIGETTPISTKEYQEIPNYVIKDSLGGEFYEIERLVENLEQFDGLQIKIVLLSDNPTKVPKCKNFRLVALA